MERAFIKGSLILFILFPFVLGAAQKAWCYAGTEGAGFLNIPTGGRPAALGGAYSALANDAYAPLLNPAGLGFLKTSQFALMHLSYLDSMSYEFASLVHPFSAGHSIGASVQNLRPGNTRSTDINGDPLGDFSGSFFAYSLGYGQSIGGVFSIGLVGKVIQSKIADFSASGVAGDLGVMVRPSNNLGFSAVVANVGSKITFIQDGDSFPSSLRMGGFYSPFRRWIFALQGTHAKTGLTSGQSGVEWNPLDVVSVRAGYKTETAHENSSAAGVSVGIGLHLAGQQFDYAWAPLGDLGDTQYFSMVLQWGEPKIPSTEVDSSIDFKFKNKFKDDKEKSEIRFQEERVYPEIRGKGLHP